jgi:hypothetical protein
VAAPVREGGGAGVPGARRGRRGAGMLTPGHGHGAEPAIGSAPTCTVTVATGPNSRNGDKHAF